MDSAANPKRGRRARRQDHEDTKELVPPDGGWGWVIIIATAIILSVQASLVSCFGVIYVHLVATGYTNIQVVGISALNISCTNLLGPLCTGWSRYYSSRRLAVIGVMVTSFGVFLCALYRNLVWYYFCFGVLAGVGNALALPQGFLIGQQYFRQKRVTANGLSIVGESLGTMLFPPLINLLVAWYSVKGAYILWAGFILHGLIGASLFQPVSWHMKPKPGVCLKSSEEENRQHSDLLPPDTATLDTGEHQTHGERRTHGELEYLAVRTEDIDESHQRFSTDAIHRGLSKEGVSIEPTIPPPVHCDDTPMGVPPVEYWQTNECLGAHRNDREMTILHQSAEGNGNSEGSMAKNNKANSGQQHKDNKIDDVELIRRPESQYVARVLNTFVKMKPSDSVRSFIEVFDQCGSAMSIEVQMKKEDRSMSKSSTKSETQVDNPYIVCGIKIPRIGRLFKFSVLKHPIFLITTFGSVANKLVYYCFVTFLPSLGHEVGVGVMAPYLLTVLALFELLAKMVVSIVSDQGWLQRRYIYIIAAISLSLATFTLTFAWDMTTLAACCGWYGLSVGTVKSLGPILLIEYLGIELLPYSYGLLLFVNGIAGLLLLPVTGWVSDAFESYTATYYLLGGLAVVPALLWSSVPFVYKDQKETTKT